MSLIVNKRATYDYEILNNVMAGIVLSGAEVKSLRANNGSLTGSFVQIVDGEAVLLNAQINPYPYANNQNYEPKATRKLLLQKKQLYELQDKVQQKGLTLVPLSFELVGKRIKLKIGLGRGRKQYEKRAKLRERDLKREQEREISP
ncbi:MAG: SsrA-binding protein SmpB [bacterium]|nr:SsrA-binding protein SmpB [bacterium]